MFIKYRKTSRLRIASLHLIHFIHRKVEPCEVQTIHHLNKTQNGISTGIETCILSVERIALTHEEHLPNYMYIARRSAGCPRAPKYLPNMQITSDIVLVLVQHVLQPPGLDPAPVSTWCSRGIIASSCSSLPSAFDHLATQLNR